MPQRCQLKICSCWIALMAATWGLLSLGGCDSTLSAAQTGSLAVADDDETQPEIPVAETQAPGSVNETRLSSDSERLADTEETIRKIGVAVLIWVHDRTQQNRLKVLEKDSGVENAWSFRKSETSRLFPNRKIRHQDLEGFLVPTYLDHLPEVDAWGHELEFAVEYDLLGFTVAGIRSPGRDGVFEGDEYLLGPFARDAFDEDIVWANGYFVRWPKRIRHQAEPEETR